MMSIQKLGAIFFLVAVAVIPVAIVFLGSGRGGIFVAGYVIGVITAPIIAIGVVRAFAILAGSTWTDILIGFLVFSVVVLVISVAAAFWSLLFMLN
jgi:hypothetical protein